MSEELNALAQRLRTWTNGVLAEFDDDGNPCVACEIKHDDFGVRELAAILDERDTNLSRIAELEGMLREVEWVYEGIELCHFCSQAEDVGHTPTCRLAALLGVSDPPAS